MELLLLAVALCGTLAIVELLGHHAAAVVRSDAYRQAQTGLIREPRAGLARRPHVADGAPQRAATGPASAPEASLTALR